MSALILNLIIQPKENMLAHKEMVDSLCPSCTEGSPSYHLLTCFQQKQPHLYHIPTILESRLISKLRVHGQSRDGTSSYFRRLEWGLAYSQVIYTQSPQTRNCTNRNQINISSYKYLNFTIQVPCKKCPSLVVKHGLLFLPLYFFLIIKMLEL